MSKKINTYTVLKNKIQAISDWIVPIPTGLSLKGIIKDSVYGMVPSDVSIIWNRSFIPSDEVLIDEDYSLVRRDLEVNLFGYEIFSNESPGIPFYLELSCEVVGGYEPYQITWTGPPTNEVNIVEGQGTQNISIEFKGGNKVYGPFIVTVRDAVNTLITKEAHIWVTRYTGTRPPGSEEDIVDDVLPLESNIREQCE